MSDGSAHQDGHWATAVQHVLCDEFGAAKVRLDISDDFDPVQRWVAFGLAPVVDTVALLRGARMDFAAQLAKLTENPTHPAWPDTAAAVFARQTGYSFAYDAHYDAAFESAVDYAADNAEMIREHFGSAEDYSEYYAESGSDMLQEIANRTLAAEIGARVHAAFAARSTTDWTALYPGAFTRGLIRSYLAAQGPKPADTLAAELQIALHRAFAPQQ